MIKHEEFPSEPTINNLIVDIFRLNGALIAFGDDLIHDLGLTSSKWQVLGALTNAERPLAMPAIADYMGISRQGVRVVLKPMLAAGLVALSPNPLHKRSPHVLVTPKGARAYRTAMARHQPFSARLAAQFSSKDLGQTLRVIRKMLHEVNVQIAELKK